jgi:imidazolonepropionase-like amidohydrolase
MNLDSPRTSHLISGSLPNQTFKHQRIITSKIFQLGPNGETLENPWTHDATIVVLKSNGRIVDVRPTNDEDLAALARSNPSAGCDASKADVLDLRGLTILPGFIDTHVHCM